MKNMINQSNTTTTSSSDVSGDIEIAALSSAGEQEMIRAITDNLNALSQSYESQDSSYDATPDFDPLINHDSETDIFLEFAQDLQSYGDVLYEISPKLANLQGKLHKSIFNKLNELLTSAVEDYVQVIKILNVGAVTQKDFYRIHSALSRISLNLDLSRGMLEQSHKSSKKIKSIDHAVLIDSIESAQKQIAERFKNFNVAAQTRLSHLNGLIGRAPRFTCIELESNFFDMTQNAVDAYTSLLAQIKLVLKKKTKKSSGVPDFQDSQKILKNFENLCHFAYTIKSGEQAELTSREDLDRVYNDFEILRKLVVQLLVLSPDSLKAEDLECIQNVWDILQALLGKQYDLALLLQKQGLKNIELSANSIDDSTEFLGIASEDSFEQLKTDFKQFQRLYYQQIPNVTHYGYADGNNRNKHAGFMLVDLGNLVSDCCNPQNQEDIALLDSLLRKICWNILRFGFNFDNAPEAEQLFKTALSLHNRLVVANQEFANDLAEPDISCKGYLRYYGFRENFVDFFHYIKKQMLQVAHPYLETDVGDSELLLQIENNISHMKGGVAGEMYLFYHTAQKYLQHYLDPWNYLNDLIEYVQLGGDIDGVLYQRNPGEFMAKIFDSLQYQAKLLYGFIKDNFENMKDELTFAHHCAQYCDSLSFKNQHYLESTKEVRYEQQDLFNNIRRYVKQYEESFIPDVNDIPETYLSGLVMQQSRLFYSTLIKIISVDENNQKQLSCVMADITLYLFHGSVLTAAILHDLKKLAATYEQYKVFLSEEGILLISILSDIDLETPTASIEMLSEYFPDQTESYWGRTSRSNYGSMFSSTGTGMTYSSSYDSDSEEYLTSEDLYSAIDALLDCLNKKLDCITFLDLSTPETEMQLIDILRQRQDSFRTKNPQEKLAYILTHTIFFKNGAEIATPIISDLIDILDNLIDEHVTEKNLMAAKESVVERMEEFERAKTVARPG